MRQFVLPIGQRNNYRPLIDIQVFKPPTVFQNELNGVFYILAGAQRFRFRLVTQNHII